MELIEQYRRWKRIGWQAVIGGIVIIVLAIGIMALTTESPIPATDKLGLHLLLDDGRGSWDISLWDEHIAVAGDILPDGGYVVQLIRADDLDVDKWQTFMDDVADHKLTPIIRLATTFDDESWTWTPPQADDDGRYRELGQAYAQFIAGLDWHTDTHYVALLNEPNNGHEWGGRPDPTAYAQFVMDVAPLLKSADEAVVILNGALDLSAPDTGDMPFPDSDIFYMSADRFMDEMFSTHPTVFQQFDRWNSHPYPLNLSAPPWERERGFNDLTTGDTVTTDAPPTLYNRGVNGYEWELWKLSQLGVSGLPVMITETGYRHAETVNADSLDSGIYPTLDEVTRYLDLILRGNADGRVAGVPVGGWTGLLLDERVEAVVLFALNGTPQEWGHTNWLAMSADGDIMDVYPMADLLKSYEMDAE